jgi:predicted TIM-barrel fold metal-dependent hydrolase
LTLHLWWALVRSGCRRDAVLLFPLCIVACHGRWTDPRQADFDKIDVHTHYFAPRSYLVPMLERWHVQAVILNYTMGEPDSLVRRRWKGVLALAHAVPNRFLTATTFDPMAIDRPDFVARTLAQLQQDFAGGAVMLKVWKDVGLVVRDRSGRFVQIDDPRLQPVWDFLAVRHIPVLVHSADPRDGWRPPDPTSPNYRYFSTHPAYYPYLHPEMPSWETVIAARNRWLARNPGLVVIGAHFGSMADDLDALSRCLDSFPNFNVDVAARLADIRRLPVTRVRRFFLDYQDRILFGTDNATQGSESDVTPAALQKEQRVVESAYPQWWHYTSRTLRLPSPVLAKFFSGNARRLLHLSTDSLPPAGREPASVRDHPPRTKAGLHPLGAPSSLSG